MTANLPGHELVPGAPAPAIHHSPPEPPPAPGATGPRVWQAGDPTTWAWTDLRRNPPPHIQRAAAEINPLVHTHGLALDIAIALHRAGLLAQS